MAAMVRELDASGALGDFTPALVQTGDRCVARRGADGAVELHLWQRQPVPDELRARLPLQHLTPKIIHPRRPPLCHRLQSTARTGTFSSRSTAV